MRSHEQLSALIEAVTDASTILIVPHNNPDPDSIASMLALGHLLGEIAGIKSLFVYHGIIGRAENRALVRYLNRPLQPMASFDWPELVPVALVDTQPGAGNVTFPPHAGVVIVIDHHDLHQPETVANFADIRPELGATSTILAEYLQAAELEPSPSLATALFYGIKTNTMGLGRNANPADLKAYYYLQSRIDVGALAKIEHAQVPANYFRDFDTAIRSARIFDHVVISYLDLMDYPDLTAEMADLFLRLERAKWVICMGVYRDTMILSVRTRSRDGGAGRLIQAIIEDRGSSGGHGTVAGGQVPLHGKDPVQLADHLSEKALRYLKIPLVGTGEQLV